MSFFQQLAGSGTRLKLTGDEHRQILALAVPMILSNISVPLLGLVDTMVIGHLAEPYYLGGVAVGAMIVSLLLWLLGFLRMSTTGLVAQAHGRGDSRETQRMLARSLWLALGLAALILLLQPLLKTAAFAMAGGSPEVQHQGQIYFDTRIWGVPAALVNLVVLGWLLGRQNARGPMWLLIGTNLVNILLDIWFVTGLEWGVAGAARATVIADYSGMLLGLWLVRLQLCGEPRLSLADWWQQAKPAQLRPLLALNRDIFIRSLSLQACFAFVTFQGARLGDTVVAANAVLMNFLMFISYGLDGFAYAVEALVGRAIGARQRVALKRAVLGAMQWSLLTGFAFSLLFGLAGEWLIGMITTLSEVRAEAGRYLPYLVAMPLVAVWCYLFDGVFIGAAEARAMRNSMLLSALGGFFPLWWLLSDYQNHALWAALLLFMALRGVTLGWLWARHHNSWA